MSHILVPLSQHLSAIFFSLLFDLSAWNFATQQHPSIYTLHSHVMTNHFPSPNFTDLGLAITPLSVKDSTVSKTKQETEHLTS